MYISLIRSNAFPSHQIGLNTGFVSLVGSLSASFASGPDIDPHVWHIPHREKTGLQGFRPGQT